MTDCFQRSRVTPQLEILDASLTAINTEMRRLTVLRKRHSQNDTYTKASICKQISKLIRKRTNMQKQTKIHYLLKEFHGLRDIASISGGHRREIISCVKSNDVVVVNSEKSTVEVFA